MNDKRRYLFFSPLHLIVTTFWLSTAQNTTNEFEQFSNITQNKKLMDTTNIPMKINENISILLNNTSESLKSKQAFDALSSLRFVNETTDSNRTMQEILVANIIASINKIKSNFTASPGDSDATKINATILLDKSETNDKKNSSQQEISGNNEIHHIFNQTIIHLEINKNQIVSNTNISEHEHAEKYEKNKNFIEVLTIEPNNTHVVKPNTTEHIFQILNYLRPGFNQTKAIHNITVLEKPIINNNSEIGNIPTLIVTYCDSVEKEKNENEIDDKEIVLQVPIKKSDMNETDDLDYLESDDIHRDNDLNHEDFVTDYNLTFTERRQLLEAADHGLQMMHELYSIKEPKLYSMGLWLDENNPAKYVAAFNAPSEDSDKYFRYGYASLQAAAKLLELQGIGNADLQGRTEEAQFPGASALRHSALLEQCPLRKTPKCPPASKRYRTHDGTCNNFSRLRWGSTMTAVQRFIPPVYSDNLQAPRRSVTGRALPSPREISTTVHEDRNVETESITHLLMQWGQLIDHDITSSSQSRGFNGSVPRCCKDGGKDFVPKDFLHPECMPIIVPAGDRFYGPKGIRCLEFIRSSPAPRDDCALGWREQVNQVSAYLDGSPLYGSSAKKSDSLRLFRNGMLRYGRVQGRKPLLSLRQSGSKDELCRGGAVHTDCFKSGDGRVNEQPGLVALHIVWLRQHNRLAQELSNLNSHWSDEKLYQETRKIIGAMIQHITYGEFLPIVLGSEVMRLFDLDLQKKGFYNGYSPKVDPSPANSFGAAAFRFGHSLVQPSFVRFDRRHRPLNNNVTLHEEPRNPSNIWSMGAVDRVLLGMVNQPIQKRDEFITEELTNHLFQTSQFGFGMDLAAINIQRGRDHGIPPYTTWREPCGLSAIKNFDNLFKVMPARAVNKLQDLYRHVDDIDLFTGGMAERPVVGGLVGPTFACIIAQQFSNLRKGDRFWYENGDLDSSFTPAQLQQIRRISLAQVLCRSLDTIDSIQPFAFLSAEGTNDRMSCRSSLMNNFDLSPWTEIDNSLDFQKAEPLKTEGLNKPSKDNSNTKGPIQDDNVMSPSNVMSTTIKALNKSKTTTKPEVTDKTIQDIMQPLNQIDDKLDFHNKKRLVDDEPIKSNEPAKQDYDDDYEVLPSQTYHQSISISNNRPHKYNRPVISVTENLDAFTYLINYVPKSTTRSWRPPTRPNYQNRPAYEYNNKKPNNHEKDVVKLTYQTYDDTYRRPQLTNQNQDMYYQRQINSSNESLDTDTSDDFKFKARLNMEDNSDDKQNNKDNADDKQNFEDKTTDFPRLVTFSHIGTYKRDQNHATDSKITQIKTLVNDPSLQNTNKATANRAHNNGIKLAQPTSTEIASIFNNTHLSHYDVKYPKTIDDINITLTNISSGLKKFSNFVADSKNIHSYPTTTTDKNDYVTRLSTFFHIETFTRPDSVNRPTRKDEYFDSIHHRVRYVYKENVLHRYPSDLLNYNNQRDYDSELRTAEAKIDAFDETNKDKETSIKKVKPQVQNTPSVNFQIIPSENSASTWAVYEAEEDEQETLPQAQMPVPNNDPQALTELPRPISLHTKSTIRRRPYTP